MNTCARCSGPAEKDEQHCAACLPFVLAAAGISRIRNRPRTPKADAPAGQITLF